MSRSDELRNRVRAIQQRDQRPTAGEPTEPTPPARPEKPKLVRQTVDLTLDQHTALASWRLNAAMALGRTRLTTQDVLATLVAVMLDDEVVARRVRAHLESQ